MGQYSPREAESIDFLPSSRIKHLRQGIIIHGSGKGQRGQFPFKSTGWSRRLLVPAHTAEEALAILRELEPTESWAIREPGYPRHGLKVMGLLLLLGLLMMFWAYWRNPGG